MEESEESFTGMKIDWIEDDARYQDGLKMGFPVYTKGGYFGKSRFMSLVSVCNGRIPAFDMPALLSVNGEMGTGPKGTRVVTPRNPTIGEESTGAVAGTAAVVGTGAGVDGTVGATVDCGCC